MLKNYHVSCLKGSSGGFFEHFTCSLKRGTDGEQAVKDILTQCTESSIHAIWMQVRLAGHKQCEHFFLLKFLSGLIYDLLIAVVADKGSSSTGLAAVSETCSTPPANEHIHEQNGFAKTAQDGTTMARAALTKL